ncbi:hypothetical protein ARMSODRAFT_441456 [Armillaria solidipes]|uniref:Uncharacterized protein n=1 Tax=Armillaria solidipes TaxID=1076256 RepID=A0A2H3BN76_9AGAR|nr:hypothetical protein ARMSODRAFT_441456 [Armillaria solidipes]
MYPCRALLSTVIFCSGTLVTLRPSEVEYEDWLQQQGTLWTGLDQIKSVTRLRLQVNGRYSEYELIFYSDTTSPDQLGSAGLSILEAACHRSLSVITTPGPRM